MLVAVSGGGPLPLSSKQLHKLLFRRPEINTLPPPLLAREIQEGRIDRATYTLQCITDESKVLESKEKVSISPQATLSARYCYEVRPGMQVLFAVRGWLEPKLKTHALDELVAKGKRKFQSSREAVQLLDQCLTQYAQTRDIWSSLAPLYQHQGGVGYQLTGAWINVFDMGTPLRLVMDIASLMHFMRAYHRSKQPDFRTIRQVLAYQHQLQSIHPEHTFKFQHEALRKYTKSDRYSPFMRLLERKEYLDLLSDDKDVLRRASTQYWYDMNYGQFLLNHWVKLHALAGAKEGWISPQVRAFKMDVHLTTVKIEREFNSLSTVDLAQMIMPPSAYRQAYQVYQQEKNLLLQEKDPQMLVHGLVHLIKSWQRMQYVSLIQYLEQSRGKTTPVFITKII